MTRPSLYITSTWQPPAPYRPAEPVAWRPPYAMLTVAAVARRYGDGPADIARRMLREIAAEQKAKGDLIWQATDRDMTGAFPVVAVAR